MIINETQHKEHHARSPGDQGLSLTIQRLVITAGTETTLVQFTNFLTCLQSSGLPVTLQGINVQRNDDNKPIGVSIRLQLVIANKLLTL